MLSHVPCGGQIVDSVASPGFVAKLEIMSWGTHSEPQGRVQQLLDD